MSNSSPFSFCLELLFIFEHPKPLSFCGKNTALSSVSASILCYCSGCLSVFFALVYFAGNYINIQDYVEKDSYLEQLRLAKD